MEALGRSINNFFFCSFLLTRTVFITLYTNSKKEHTTLQPGRKNNPMNPHTTEQKCPRVADLELRRQVNEKVDRCVSLFQVMTGLPISATTSSAFVEMHPSELNRMSKSFRIRYYRLRKEVNQKRALDKHWRINEQKTKADIKHRMERGKQLGDCDVCMAITARGLTMHLPCKHPRVQIVSRDEESEFVECKECGEIFESSEFRDMTIEESTGDEA